jgi:hypothetical protein
MKREMTDAELADIKRLLDTAYCNPLWRKHVSALIEEVQRLKKNHCDDHCLEQATALEHRHDFKNDTVIL